MINPDNDLEIIEAEEILDKIEKFQAISYSKIHIKGDINIDEILQKEGKNYIISSPIRIINSKIEGSINFDSAIFKTSLNLSKTQFSEEANFNATIFCGNAFFYGSIFQQDAKFIQSKFCKNAYFNGINFKNDLLFTGSHTHGDLFFYGSALDGDAFFNGSKFYSETDFRNVHFLHQALFSRSEFVGDCIFNGAIFKKDAHFSDCIFKGDLKFGKTLFKENACFKFTQFKNKVTFDDAQFDKNVDFSGIHVFRWGQIPGKDEERLVKFLAMKFDIDWIKKARFAKGVDCKTVNASAGTNSLSLSLNDKETRIILGINNDQRDEFLTELDPDEQITFKGVNSFENDASFIGAKIRGNINFDGLQFCGSVHFCKFSLAENAFFRDSKFKGDAKFNEFRTNGIIFFDRARFSKIFSLDNSIIRTIRLNGANFEPRSILFINHADIQRLVVKWDQIRDHLDYNNVVSERELSERMSSTYSLLIRNFNNLEYLEDARRCSDYFDSTKNEVEGRTKIFAKEILDKIKNHQAIMYNKIYIPDGLEIKDVLQKEKNFYVIKSTIKITDSKIHGVMNFNDACFKESVVLTNTQFESYVNFSNACFKESVVLTNTQFETDVEFVNTHFLKNSYFNAALFKGAVRFLNSCFKGDTYFISAEFEGNAFFKESTFKGELDSRGANFRLDARFDTVVFERDANFSFSQFEGNAEFMGSQFREYAGFGDVQFFRYANFNNAIFKIARFAKTAFYGIAYFQSCKFFKHAYFRMAKFSQDAHFHKSKFKNAVFNESKFKEDLLFNDSIFYGIVIFNESELDGTVNFDSTIFKRNLKLDHIIGNIIRLNGKKFYNTSIIFLMDSNFSQLVVVWENIKDHLDYSGIKSTKESIEKRTITTYFLLMKNFQNLGLFDEADSCYHRYKIAATNAHSKKIKFPEKAKSKIIKIINICFYGYGIFPQNPIITGVFIIIFFSFIFMILEYFMISEYSVIPEFLMHDPWRSLINSIYLSLYIFTSNPRPDSFSGIYALVGIIERISGWLLMASFLVVLAKKTIR